MHTIGRIAALCLTAFLLLDLSGCGQGPKPIRVRLLSQQGLSSLCGDGDWLLTGNLRFEVFIDDNSEPCGTGFYMTSTPVGDIDSGDWVPEQMDAFCDVPRNGSGVISALMQVEDTAGPNRPIAMFFSLGAVDFDDDRYGNSTITLSRGVYRADQIEGLQAETKTVWLARVASGKIFTFDDDDDGCPNLVEGCDGNLGVAGNTACSL